MTTSQIASISSEIVDGGLLSAGAMAYFRERQRLRLYEVVIREFMRSGITKAELARRMGRRPEQVTRWLGAPGNWTLDTVSDLLLAISAGELEASVAHPLASWVDEDRDSVTLPDETEPVDAGTPQVDLNTAQQQQTRTTIGAARAALDQPSQRPVNWRPAASSQSTFQAANDSLPRQLSALYLVEGSQHPSNYDSTYMRAFG